MNLRKVLGVVLLTAGILCLVYRGFNYTKETHSGEFGPIKLQLKETDRVEIPVWLGVLLAAGGGALLVVGRK